jgi:hypothetical protein
VVVPKLTELGLTVIERTPMLIVSFTVPLALAVAEPAAANEIAAPATPTSAGKVNNLLRGAAAAARVSAIFRDRREARWNIVLPLRWLLPITRSIGC